VINKRWNFIWSPYTVFGFILGISSPLFFLRGIGIFDDSVYLKIGELINQDLYPYRDVFDNKPPGIYYLSALIAWIGQNHWLTNRIFLFIFAVILGFSVIRYTKSIWGNLSAYFAALIFGTSYIITQGYSFHTEQFCTALGFAAIYLVSQRSSERITNWMLTGCFVGMAFIFKQVAILYLMAFILCELFLALIKTISFTIAIRRCVFLLIGFCLFIAIPFTWLFVNGFWSNFYKDVFLGVVPFAGNEINFIDILKLWLRVPATLLVIPLAVIFIINKNLRTSIINSKNFPEILILVVTGCLSLLPTLKVNSNTHYSGTAILALSIAESVIISQLCNSKTIYFSKIKKNIQKKLILVWSLLFIPYLIGISWGSFLMTKENRIGYDLAQMHEVRNILNQHLNPYEPVLVLSENAARLNYMSGRLPLTKYIYYYWNTDMKINQAAKLLFTSEVAGAILELPNDTPVNWLSEKELDDLNNRYSKIELSSQNAAHTNGNKVEILISKNKRES
jgi:hypothetical protein